MTVEASQLKPSGKPSLVMSRWRQCAIWSLWSLPFLPLGIQPWRSCRPRPFFWNHSHSFLLGECQGLRIRLGNLTWKQWRYECDLTWKHGYMWHTAAQHVSWCPCYYHNITPIVITHSIDTASTKFTIITMSANSNSICDLMNLDLREPVWIAVSCVLCRTKPHKSIL